MSDIFEQYDVYKGDLDTSDPYNLAAIKQAEGKSLAKAGESFAGGVVSGYAGLPGEIESYSRGGAKLYGQTQQNMIKMFGALADQVGIDGISKAVNTLFGSEQNKSAMEALLQGLDEETVLPTTEEVQNWLKEKGLSFDNEGAALIGEILAPASYGIKYGKQAIKSIIGK